jgi:hypothetical protein
MVKGLDVFRKHFAQYSQHYVLIGGTAATLVMEDAGLDFRATKDLDIVLYVELLTPEFGLALWQFIENGQYEIRQSSSGKPRFYRFQKPGNPDFPEMLELFSRTPEGLDLTPEAHLTPIPLDDPLSSLSAILLDQEYYDFVIGGKQTADELTWIDVDRLIPLKASAWLDLTARQAKGEAIDTKNIRKHLNDVFRLSQLLVPTSITPLPEKVGADLDVLLINVTRNNDIDLKSLGLRNTTADAVIARIRQAFGRTAG